LVVAVHNAQRVEPGDGPLGDEDGRDVDLSLSQGVIGVRIALARHVHLRFGWRREMRPAGPRCSRCRRELAVRELEVGGAVLARATALVMARPAASSVPRASARKRSPADVSRTPRGRRWNSVTPSSVSMSRICFGQGWLRDAQAACGVRKTVLLSDRYEVAKMP